MDLVASLQRLLDAGAPWVSQYGLWIVALGACGQAFPGAGLVLPGFAISLAAGAFCAAGALHFTHAIAAAWLGALIGLTVTFLLGRRIGTVRRESRLQIRERVRCALERDATLPLYYVYAAPVRLCLPYLAGSMGYPLPRWLACNALAVLPWMACQLSIGYVAGRTLHGASPLLTLLALALLLAAAMTATALVLRRVLRLGADAEDAAEDARETGAEAGPVRA
jgi:membrane protein DedA with SNARE-associated domain